MQPAGHNMSAPIAKEVECSLMDISFLFRSSSFHRHPRFGMAHRRGAATRAGARRAAPRGPARAARAAARRAPGAAAAGRPAAAARRGARARAAAGGRRGPGRGRGGALPAGLGGRGLPLPPARATALGPQSSGLLRRGPAATGTASTRRTVAARAGAYGDGAADGDGAEEGKAAAGGPLAGLLGAVAGLARPIRDFGFGRRAVQEGSVGLFVLVGFCASLLPRPPPSSPPTPSPRCAAAAADPGAGAQR